MNFLAADGAPNAPFGPWLGPRKNAAECRNGPATHPSITFTRRAKAKKEEIEEEEEEEEEEERRERKTVKSQDSLTGSTQSDWVSLGFARVLSSSDNGFSKVIIRVA